MLTSFISSNKKSGKSRENVVGFVVEIVHDRQIHADTFIPISIWLRETIRTNWLKIVRHIYCVDQQLNSQEKTFLENMVLFYFKSSGLMILKKANEKTRTTTSAITSILKMLTNLFYFSFTSSFFLINCHLFTTSSLFCETTFCFLLTKFSTHSSEINRLYFNMCSIYFSIVLHDLLNWVRF